MTHQPLTVLATLLALVVAGCASPGGTGTLTGTNAPGASILLTRVNVVDGSLRDITATNNATAPIPAGTWAFHLAGTTSGRASTHDAAIQGTGVAQGASAKLSFAGDKQPDWQDGTDLTISVTAPGGATGKVTIRTV